MLRMNVFFSSVAFLAIILLGSQTTFAQSEETADIVIIGGGTAGSALAGRLCVALPNMKITLLERGKARNTTEELIISAARLAYDAWASPAVTDIFPSEPSPGILNRVLIILTGKTLGGSSAINAGVWSIPPLSSIRKWRIKGLKNPKKISTLFNRAAQVLQIGTIPVSNRQDYFRDWQTGALKSGFPNLSDPFGRDSKKIGFWDQKSIFTDQGRRLDSYKAYVLPVLSSKCRNNLRVVTSATVSEIVHEKLASNKKKYRAIAVKYTLPVNGQPKEISLKVRKQVLLSAGPYGSPTILQRSGIGPSSVLKSAGITPSIELPVGSRVQGRSTGIITSIYQERPLAVANDNAKFRSAEALQQWRAGNGGPLAIPIGSTVARFGPGYIESTMAFPSFGDLASQGPLISSACVPDPLSFGSISIRSNAANVPPKVNLNLLGSQADVDRQKGCLARMRKLHVNFPVEFGAVEVDPGAKPFDDTFVRNNTQNAYHMVGGCATGSVTDRKLRVKGFGNLRVVDSSVIPSMTSASGPMASVFMLAEYVAERIAEKLGEADFE